MDQQFPSPYDPDMVKRRMDYIKEQHRPQFETLEDWSAGNYAKKFPNMRPNQIKWLEYLDTLTNGQIHEQAESNCTLALKAYETQLSTPVTHKNVNQPPVSMSILKSIKGIERRNYDDFTPEQFRQEYENISKPVIIKNAISSWPCKDWTLEELGKSKYAKSPLRLGDDEDDRAIREPVDMYLQYLNTQVDDSPLYLFEDDFGERPASAMMVKEYTPPKYFSEDLFLLMAPARRPPFRWIIAGSTRCGTKCHIDPLGTSAWNALMSGMKRWVLFSPKLAAHLANGSFLYNQQEKALDRSLEAVEYFCEIVPRMREWILSLPEEQREEYQMMECLQYKDEVIFVPNGWHHAVVNMYDSVAFTQNWASAKTFMPVWRVMCGRRRNLARRLFDRIQAVYPDLAKQIEEESKNDPLNKDFFLEPQHDPKMKPRRVRVYSCVESELKAQEKQLDFIRKLIPDFDQVIKDKQRDEVLHVLMQGNVCSSDSDDSEEETSAVEDEEEDEYE